MAVAIAAVLTRRASGASTRYELDDSSTDTDTIATTATSSSLSLSLSRGHDHDRHRHVHVNSIFPPRNDLADASLSDNSDVDGDEQDERRERLADIARCASLADVQVDVAIAHTRHRLRARFFVEMTRLQPRRTTWGVGTSLSELRDVQKRMRRVVRGHLRSGRSCDTRNEPCAICLTLQKQLREWEPISKLSVLSGKHRISEKAARVERFFCDVFKLMAAHAQWAYQCAALRELLQIVENLARVRYPGERDSLAAIAKFRPLSSSSSSSSECMICLERLEVEQEGDDNRRVSQRSKKEAATRIVEQSRSGVRLPCGHEFHDTCVSRWLSARLDCPVCRAPIASTAKLDVSILAQVDASSLVCTSSI